MQALADPPQARAYVSAKLSAGGRLQECDRERLLLLARADLLELLLEHGYAVRASDAK